MRRDFDLFFFFDFDRKVFRRMETKMDLELKSQQRSNKGTKAWMVDQVAAMNSGQNWALNKL